jgi:integrase
MAQTLTDKDVKTLAPPASGNRIVYDSEMRGLGLRITAAGHRSWIFNYRFRGAERRLTIGDAAAYPVRMARKHAGDLRRKLDDGEDPMATRDAANSAPSLAAFAARYLAEYAAGHHKPRTRAEEERLLKLHILPVLGTVKLVDIGKSDAARLHAKAHETPVTANRALAVLSAVLGWAERVGERPDGSNPCRHVDRYPEKARERLVNAEELARLGETLANAETGGVADWRAVALVRLLTFTGARLSEILGLRWDWIDLQGGVARLPDSKTGAKNLYLSAPALAVLAALPRSAGNPHLLPGERPGAPLVPPQKAWQRIRRTAGLPDIRLHDLRHAFASTAVAAGDSLFIVGKLLGHRQSSTTERYSHLAPDPARAVADRTGERLRAMLDGLSGDVVPMTTARSRPHA